MTNGVYIGMSGAIAAQRRLDIAANNVANASTPGFRQQRAQFEAFLVPTGNEQPVSKGFTRIGATAIDLTQGAITPTGNPLDVAIDGRGFFVVDPPGGGGPLLTRAGNFRVAVDGTLVDVMGNAVRAEGGGPILLRPDGGPPSVGSDGSVTQDGTEVARITVMDAPSDRLSPAGDNHLRAAEQDLVAVTTSKLQGGALESSNVNPVRGLVELVLLTQEFQTNQKVMGEYRKLDQKLLSSR